jgi:hypothetical protein
MIVIGVRLVVGQENYDSQGKNRGNREQAGRQGNRKDRRPVRKGGIEGLKGTRIFKVGLDVNRLHGCFAIRGKHVHTNHLVSGLN